MLFLPAFMFHFELGCFNENMLKYTSWCYFQLNYFTFLHNFPETPRVSWQPLSRGFPSPNLKPLLQQWAQNNTVCTRWIPVRNCSVCRAGEVPNIRLIWVVFQKRYHSPPPLYSTVLVSIVITILIWPQCCRVHNPVHIRQKNQCINSN
jgi:hypothetical protein